MYYKVLPRQYSVYIYENPEDKNYIASCQVLIYGDKGFMYTINGVGFYKCFSTKEVVEQLFKDLKVTSLEGYVVKSHAKLMRIILREFANVEIGNSGKIGDIDAIWITISMKGNSDGSQL